MAIQYCGSSGESDVFVVMGPKAARRTEQWRHTAKRVASVIFKMCDDELYDNHRS